MDRNIGETFERNFDIKIGNKIRDIRISKGIKQKTLSDVLEVSYQEYQKYETGQNRISMPVLVDLCYHLKVNVSYVSGLDINNLSEVKNITIVENEENYNNININNGFWQKISTEISSLSKMNFDLL